jgi:hypothetical protein
MLAVGREKRSSGQFIRASRFIVRALYIAKVRKDEDGPWEYVDETDCATERQRDARRFRDRKAAKALALDYDCEYKIVRLVPRKWRSGQVALLAADEAAARAFGGENSVELNEYDLVVLSAHFARYRMELTARLGQFETYYNLLKARAKERIAHHLAKAAREEKKRRAAATATQRSISRWKARAGHAEQGKAKAAAREVAYVGLVSEVNTKKRELEGYEKKLAVYEEKLASIEEKLAEVKADSDAQRNIAREKSAAFAQVAHQRDAALIRAESAESTARQNVIGALRKHAHNIHQSCVSGSAQAYGIVRAAIEQVEEDTEFLRAKPRRPTLSPKEGPPYRIVYTYASGATYVTIASWSDRESAKLLAKHALALTSHEDDDHRITGFSVVGQAVVSIDPAAGVIAWERNKDLTGGAR